MTTTARTTWPTADDFTRALAAFGASLEAIENQREALCELVDLDVHPSVVEDAEPVTFETLGAVSQFVVLLEQDYESLGDELRTLRQVRDALAFETVAERRGDDAR